MRPGLLAAVALLLAVCPALAANDLKRSQPPEVANLLAINDDFTLFVVPTPLRPVSALHVRDVAKGKVVSTVPWDSDWGKPYGAALSSKGKLAVHTDSHPASGSLRIFDGKTGKLERNIQGGGSQLMRFSPDGRFLVGKGKGAGSSLSIWDLESQNWRETADLPGGRFPVDISADSTLLAYNDGQRTGGGEVCYIVVRKLDGKPGVFLNGEPHVMEVREKNIRALAFSPDGKLLAMASDDFIKVYDVTTAKIAQRLEGHLDIVKALAFHPDGKRLASYADDKTIRLWDVTTGREAAVVQGLTKEYETELKFARDGKKLLWRVHFYDGTIKSKGLFWAVPK
jgi:WD40 repeat protein